mgnify:CR=1 FL=1
MHACKLYVQAMTTRPDFVAITETWFDSTVDDAVLLNFFPDYNMFRVDRPLRGGGCILLCRSGLMCSSLACCCVDGVESLFVTIPSLDRPTAFGVVYRKPSCTHAQFDNWVAQSDIVNYSHNFNLILTGDFNFPHIEWEIPVALNGDLVHSSFLHLTQSIGLTQCNLTPTRGAHVLDLVFFSKLENLVSVDVFDSLPDCDHDALFFKFSVNSVSSAISIIHPTDNEINFDFSRADYQALSLAIAQVAWDTVLNPINAIDDVWVLFNRTLHALFEQYIPHKKQRKPHYTANTLPRDLLDLIHHKKAAWSKYRKSQSSADKELFTRLSKSVKCRMIEYNREAEANVLKDGSLKSFYKFVKSKLSPGSSQSLLSADNGSSLLSSAESAAAFNNHFAKSFTADLPTVINFPKRSAVVMPPVTFTPDVIESHLLAQNDSMSFGVDGLPQVFFKSCARSLAAPLSIIFSKSYSSGTIPHTWRSANVTPIYKGSGSAHSPDNYRPISLTCICSKVMELVVRDNILSFLHSNGLLSSTQHGFLPGKSTTSQLIESLNDWTYSLENGNNVDCIYLDFSKAFDCISHSKLITKISAYGIDNLTVAWVSDFLKDRRQRVKVNGAVSDWLPCISGVPQGSVLGPLLFVIYTNDLPDIVHNATIKMYADDVKLYMPVCDIAAHALLQDDLNRIVAWASSWQLKLNAKKCVLFRLKRNLNLPTYVLNGTNLTMPEYVKDLGVYLTPKLDFTYHCNHIANVAFKRCYLLLSAFVTRDYDFLLRMYITFVRPLLEYSAQVWSPHLLSNIDKIESVQRHFTKSFPGLKDLPYPERLRVLNMQSLEVRRLRADCVLLQKIRLGYVDIPFESLFTLRSTVASRRDLRSGNNCFHVPVTHLNLRTFAYPIRAARLWNNLPVSITNNNVSIALFKNSLLDDHLLPYVRGRALQGQ